MRKFCCAYNSPMKRRKCDRTDGAGAADSWVLGSGPLAASLDLCVSLSSRAANSKRPQDKAATASAKMRKLVMESFVQNKCPHHEVSEPTPWD
jgi:hypothetical protein